MLGCPLCKKTTTRPLETIHNVLYIECSTCSTFFKHPKHWIGSKAEKARYLSHNNDVNDVHYQEFVMPIVDAIKSQFSPNHNGLDYGAGTGPVIAKLLSDTSYDICLYDPFFHPNKEALKQSYNYIICCEVMEHFHHPNDEFQRLASLLKEEGILFCMTGLIPNDILFKDWWYIKDTTHVVFYSEKSLKWIQQNFDFSKVVIEDAVISFFK